MPLPADLLLKIFHQLPFKDRVRLAGVNRSFRNVSNESINKMKSLIVNHVNDDVITMAAHKFQSISSLFESCSLSLESIEATDYSFNKHNKWLPKLMSEFVYPKLKHLEIAVFDCGQTKKLISRSKNLRSVILDLNSGFEWPENIVFEKLEKLEIRSLTDDIHSSIDGEKYADLSTMLRLLIGKAPMLKQISIKSGRNANFIFSVEELNQLLASTPMIEVLVLNLNLTTWDDPDFSIKMCQEFQSSIPTWNLPNLTNLTINVGNWDPPNSAYVLRQFPNLFPQLKSFISDIIKQSDDGDFLPLSQLQHLQEFRLRRFDMTKEKFIDLITSLPSIVVLELGSFGRDHENICDNALSRLENLRELRLSKGMTKDELIAMVTSLPSLAILEIKNILDAHDPKEFIDFIKETTATFDRKLEIHVGMFCRGYGMYQMEDVLKEMQNHGGPIVELDSFEIGIKIRCIRYKSLVE